MHALHQGVRERTGPRDLGPDQPRHAYRRGHPRARADRQDRLRRVRPVHHALPDGRAATVFDALANPDKIVLVQIAPAVRSAWGEELGIPREEATVERLACALRRVGFEYVFDTDFSADLTIMEEGSELLERLGAAAKGEGDSRAGPCLRAAARAGCAL